MFASHVWRLLCSSDSSGCTRNWHLEGGGGQMGLEGTILAVLSAFRGSRMAEVEQAKMAEKCPNRGELALYLESSGELQGARGQTTFRSCLYFLPSNIHSSLTGAKKAERMQFLFSFSSLSRVQLHLISQSLGSSSLKLVCEQPSAEIFRIENLNWSSSKGKKTLSYCMFVQESGNKLQF